MVDVGLVSFFCTWTSGLPSNIVDNALFFRFMSLAVLSMAQVMCTHVWVFNFVSLMYCRGSFCVCAYHVVFITMVL